MHVDTYDTATRRKHLQTKRERESEKEEGRERELRGLVTHFPPCSESLDELVLEPEPDELESSSSDSSELELLLALSREDLGSRLEVGRPPAAEGE